MKHIQLTQGQVALIDDADFRQLVQQKWYAVKKRRRYYAYTKRSTPMTHLLLHPPKGYVADHINGDTLDNRRSNLRICTQRENKLNAGARRNSKSGYRGVTYKPHARGWMAQIQEHGKFHFLGYYKTATEAALAYDQKALELRGEFARRNLPRDEQLLAA